MVLNCAGETRKRDVTTMFTYSHENPPLRQSERAYYLSYFIKCGIAVSKSQLVYNIVNIGTQGVHNCFENYVSLLVNATSLFGNDGQKKETNLKYKTNLES